MISTNSMKSKIYEYICKNGGVSYVEIERLFEKYGYNFFGTVEACSRLNKNCVFWYGWNEQAFQILSELIHEKKIERTPSEYFVYLVDGKALDMPIAKSVNLKTPHWLPCVFNTVSKAKEVM